MTPYQPPPEQPDLPLALLAACGAVGVLVFQASPAPVAPWLLLSVLYGVIEIAQLRRGRAAGTVGWVFGGPGWVALVAMVGTLDASGIVLAAAIPAIVVGAVHRLERLDPLALWGRFLGHAPAVAVTALVAGVLPRDLSAGWAMALAGAAGGAMVHVLRSALPHISGTPVRLLTGHAPAVWLPAEMAWLGGTAGLLGHVLAAGGLGVPLVVAAIGLVAATDQLRGMVDIARRSTIDSLLIALEAKDLYTRGHCQRVAALSVELGRDLGLGPEAIDRLETAALLHDFGKVVTPRRLLRKPARLTDDEYCRIQEHAAVVTELLAGVEFLGPVLPIIAEHHHHFDGSAYGDHPPERPQSLEARILSVADAFDAMTTNRPYRRALSRDFAFDELRRGAGRQFDPDVVGALVALISRSRRRPVAPGAGSDAEGRALAEGMATHG